MADSKRQSVSGKGAGSKTGLQQGSPDVEALNKAVGARIRITTHSTPSTTTIEGTIFTATTTPPLLAIKEDDKSSTPAPPNPSSANTSSSTNSTPNYRIISIANIASYHITPGGDTDVLNLVKELETGEWNVDKDAMKKREAVAVRKVREMEERRGKGVSGEAQELFDHIVRTLPSRWNDKQIIVNESVIVEPPYGVANCKAPAAKEVALTQVKKVVEGFWAKRKGGAGAGAGAGAGNKAAGNGRVTPSPAVPNMRKGG
ncbi:hypothetical protein EJ08DRAFT_700117 [Tothia fuscella]|uniref:AD domain-containing protein n=1 Tax=Tothia fuscella TaxID=1048955 RepID=A0A9P4TW75_9PEZI|nr:hypothetical protein EJ08DRAFT_700117 [Tothia fuscella]